MFLQFCPPRHHHQHTLMALALPLLCFFLFCFLRLLSAAKFLGMGQLTRSSAGIVSSVRTGAAP
eukprot:m.32776 g.32776  ORF g.32776 m.32776 type:complete len:64 (-) comp10153_c0_seq1:53-244(-)